jgi:tRNA (mo5U34)-methyltransferase
LSKKFSIQFTTDLDGCDGSERIVLIRHNPSHPSKSVVNFGCGSVALRLCGEGAFVEVAPSTNNMNREELRKRLESDAARSNAEMASGSWWHSIDLGNGVITEGVHPIEELRDNFRYFKLPEDLRGKSLLDIGCWDGFYSFESERRGARVTSVDCWRPENFFRAHRALDSQAEFHELSVYDVTREHLGAFDIVLFLGVLYHLRHPLLALEQVCEVTREFAIIETHVIDNIYQSQNPVMEFYEFDELGGQYDNWWGPNVECLTKMARSAGFARVELLRMEQTRATIKAHRRWNDKPATQSSHLRIRDCFNAVTIDRRFPRRGRHAFAAILMEGLPENARRWELRVEIGGFGANPIYAGPSGNPDHAGLTQINVPVPPGLEMGETDLCVWHQTELSNSVRIDLIEGTQF